MRGLVCTLILAGCATATPGESGGGADASIKLDGNGGGKMDAPMQMIDAPSGPQMATLTQTTSQALKAGNSIACGNSTGTRSNNYYRVFDLAAAGITSDFHVSQVSFQVESCDHVSSGNGINVAVRVGTYNGTPGTTLTTGSMTILASNASVAVPEVVEDVSTTPPTTPGATVNAPITATVTGGQKLLVEVDVPDGANNYGFYFGSNDGGESAYGYLLATDCSITNPTNISTLGTPAPRHLLLTVTGTY